MRKSFEIVGLGFIVLWSLIALGPPILLGFASTNPRLQPPDSALPALVRDLPGGTVDDERAAFQQRVRTRYREGMSADTLAHALRGDGFHINRLKNGREGAFFEQRGFPCVRDWNISWARDGSGRATDIKTWFIPSCL